MSHVRAPHSNALRPCSQPHAGCCSRLCPGGKLRCAPGSRDKKGNAQLNPDHYYLLMSMMKYGSLSAALIFAMKIVVFAVGSI
jgi:hypothetical protein